MANSAIPQIDEQIRAIEDVLNDCAYDRKALEFAVLTLGVFAQDPNAYRAYAKKLREAKQNPAVKEVLDTFEKEGAYIGEIRDR